jgi:hypothetical protein
MPPTLPIDLTAIIGVFMGSLMVLIPIAGLTARFALKPIVESIARMRDSSNRSEAIEMLERRTALLEQEVQNITGIREDVSRLVEELEFQRSLGSPAHAREARE